MVSFTSGGRSRSRFVEHRRPIQDGRKLWTCEGLLHQLALKCTSVHKPEWVDLGGVLTFLCRLVGSRRAVPQRARHSPRYCGTQTVLVAYPETRSCGVRSMLVIAGMFGGSAR